MFFKFLLLTFLRINSTAHAWDFNDFKTEASSPVNTSAKNVLYVGTGLTLTVLIFEDLIVDPTQREFVDHQPLGDLSKIGDLGGQFIPNAAYIIAQSIAGSLGQKDGYSRAVGMIKASIYSTTVTTSLKYAIREPRPSSRKERDSFPSGHSTSAFTFAGYVYEEHGWKWGAPALVLASFVGASRMNDNRHYLHDVLAGATIGMAYGIGVAKIDKDRAKEDKHRFDLTIVPIFDSTTNGLAMVIDF